MFHNRSFIVLVALALLVTGTIVLACAPAPTPIPAPTPVPATEANKALVRRYYDQFVQAGNLNALDGFVTPNYKRYLSPAAAPLNAAAQKQRMAGLRAVSSDFKLTIDHLIAEGDLVAIGSTYRGTYTGAFMGIPPSGKQGTFASFEITRIENGKIAEHWGGPDMMDMVLQAGGVVSAAPLTPAPSEVNKALIRRYVEQVPNGGNLNALDYFVSPDYKRYLSAAATPINAAGNKQRLAGLRAVFPDLKITIDDMSAEGDRVMYRGTARGTQQVAFMGIPPSGKQGTVTVIEIFRIENGKIVEHWGGPDTMDLVQQLGGVVSAAPPK